MILLYGCCISWVLKWEDGPLQTQNTSELEIQIRGTFSQRYLIEVFRNSGYFAILIVLLFMDIRGFTQWIDKQAPERDVRSRRTHFHPH